MSREKRAVAIFGLSAGTALIVTGLTGSILLRRLRPSMLGTAHPPTGAVSAPTPAARPIEATAIVEPPQTGRFPPTRIRDDLAGIRSDFGSLYAWHDAEGEAKLPRPAELGFSPALDALAALAIATALTFGAFGGGIWWSARAFEADSVRRHGSPGTRFDGVHSRGVDSSAEMSLRRIGRKLHRCAAPARQSLPSPGHRAAHPGRHPSAVSLVAG